MMKLPEDYKLAAAIERRRKMEEERKCRIFNRRQLVVGIDKAALERQIEEKRNKESEEREKERAFARQTLESARMGILADAAIREEKRELDREIETFRKIYQRKEQSRDFDLNDPDELKKALPARLKDDDPRCGMASAQKFEGEDLSSALRTRFLNAEITAALAAQAEERRCQREEERAAQMAQDAAALARDARAVQLAAMEEDLRRRIRMANQSYNMALMEEAAALAGERRALDAERDRQEIVTAMTSDMLTENAEGAVYRGMSPDQVRAIYQYREVQIEERRNRESEDAMRDATIARQLNMLARCSEMSAAHHEAAKREEEQRIAQTNLALAQQQASQKRYMDKVVYTNVPTASFYEQFNASTR